ncbi:MAG: VCP-like ATPase [Methanomassiliicoccales archaeon PtaU1.Bin124]|nr:MAG: VCP-like ATPase [Methanomassiliicoccales archaeon PtaU1.Bin124]
MSETVVLRVAKAQHQSEVGFGRARIDTQTRKALGVEQGDIIEIVGKRSTAAKVFRAAQEDEGKGLVRIDGILRSNANVSMGEKVTVQKADTQPASKVTVAPKVPEGKQIRFGTGVEDLIRKGLVSRPLVKGDELIIPNIALMGGWLPFKVVNTAPAGVVVVGDHTELVVKTEPTEAKDTSTTSITYDDVGGLDEELQRVREMIELPLKHPELFDRLGIDAPKGVLLYGPPGTGKTLLAKAVANEAGASFYSIQGPEIISKYYGQSEEKLRERFEEAEKNAPSLIFIDEIDSIAPKREDVTGELERRVVAQMLTLMDGLSGRGQVIVIAATNREDAIDPALRRPGRFDREIEIGVPSRKGRREILEIHTRGMPLEEGFDIERFAAQTHGFVGADLAALAREAAMKCLGRYVPELELDKAIPPEVLEKMRVTMDDFQEALKDMEPSAMREVLVEIPHITWQDVGGLENVKQQLREMVELPLDSPEAFKRLGIRPAKGILLYGPPGTGKTMLAKAVATESRANFISIKGPEIMSKWVGESEKAVRQAFKKAKQVAPSVVFLDEIDAIAPRRGSGGDSDVTERVVNQLLTSIDGMESLEAVTVIAATNRPDIVDPALLRPGRFDRLILIPQPDEDARLSILQVHTKRMPLKDVDLVGIAARTDGYVGADLENLCREAAMVALREDRNAMTVEGRHFEAALKVIKASVSKDITKQYENLSRTLEKVRMGVDEMGIYR